MMQGLPNFDRFFKSTALLIAVLVTAVLTLAFMLVVPML